MNSLLVYKLFNPYKLKSDVPRSAVNYALKLKTKTKQIYLLFEFYNFYTRKIMEKRSFLPALKYKLYLSDLKNEQYRYI